jgi:hypothetical protein
VHAVADTQIINRTPRSHDIGFKAADVPKAKGFSSRTRIMAGRGHLDEDQPRRIEGVAADRDTTVQALMIEAANGANGSVIVSGFDEITGRTRDNPEPWRGARTKRDRHGNAATSISENRAAAADLTSFASKLFTSAREVATIRPLGVEPALSNYSENPHLA